MSAVLLILDAAAIAVVLTVLLALGQRMWGERTARRLAAYQARVHEPLTAYVVGADDEPPPRPRTAFERRVMRQNLLAMAPNVKGDAAVRVADCYRAYGLVRLARRDLDARDGLTRVRAAEALGSMGVGESEPWLRERLRHSHDPLLQLACARALAGLGAVDALPEIVTALAASGAESGEVAEILLAFGPLAVPFLRERAAGSPAAERRLAVAALGEIRALEAAPQLRVALADDDPEVAAAAARALGQVGDTEAVVLLLALLENPQRPWFAHVAAAGALGALDDPAAAPTLARALDDEHWDVRNAASRSLATLGEAGLQAVAAAAGELGDAGIAHYAGTLDVEDRWGAVIERATAGDADLQALVERAAAAGVTARLEEMGLVAAGEER